MNQALSVVFPQGCHVYSLVDYGRDLAKGCRASYSDSLYSRLESDDYCVIRHPTEVDESGEPLFWSNSSGWGALGEDTFIDLRNGDFLMPLHTSVECLVNVLDAVEEVARQRENMKMV